MKQAIIAIALFAAFGASAQTLGQSQNNASTSNAGASNQGVNVISNSYGAPAQAITTDGRSDLHTNQAWGAAAAIAPAGTAPCWGQGKSFTVQTVPIGGAYAGPGEKDIECKFGNLIATVRNIEAAAAPQTVRNADGSVGVIPANTDLYNALKSLGCKMEDVADAYEATTKPCDAEPPKYADRVRRVKASAPSASYSSDPLIRERQIAATTGR